MGYKNTLFGLWMDLGTKGICLDKDMRLSPDCKRLTIEYVSKDLKNNYLVVSRVKRLTIRTFYDDTVISTRTIRSTVDLIKDFLASVRAYIEFNKFLHENGLQFNKWIASTTDERQKMFNIWLERQKADLI